LSEPAPYEERYFASSDGLKLYYRDYRSAGDRVPVLCIPGLTRNSRDFEFIAAHLAGSRRVIVTDLRGRGKSAYAKDPRHYTVAIEAADMFRLMGDAGMREVIVLGTSRGGIVAMTIAATRPDVLRGVILNDIGGEIEALGLSRIVEFIGRETPFPNWDAAVEYLKQTYANAFPDVSDERWLAFANAIYREENGKIVPDYDPALAEATRAASPGIKPDSPGVPLWPLFSALGPLPALVLRGENSDLLSADTLKRMHSQKQDLVSAVIPRCGHAPSLDEPVAIAAIDQFLEKLGR
jgi:pimeloyl-ACP methyl ester carboxylesterase